MSVLERFASHTELTDDGHLLWTGHKNKDGYPQFWYEGRAWYAHRWLYYHMTGKDPDPGMDVHHRCGMRSCVWPHCLEEKEADMHRREALERGRHRIRFGG